MTTIDHQQAAVEAVAKVIAPHAYDKALWRCTLADGRSMEQTASDAEVTAREALAAATPHLRAAWEQPIRELHRPVHAVFSWADGPRYEEPCETCHGALGVHECGCWADTQLEYVCAECHRLGSGSKGVYDYTWPCPTMALLEGGAE